MIIIMKAGHEKAMYNKIIMIFDTIFPLSKYLFYFNLLKVKKKK